VSRLGAGGGGKKKRGTDSSASRSEGRASESAELRSVEVGGGEKDRRVGFLGKKKLPTHIDAFHQGRTRRRQEERDAPFGLEREGKGGRRCPRKKKRNRDPVTNLKKGTEFRDV